MEKEEIEKLKQFLIDKIKEERFGELLSSQEEIVFKTLIAIFESKSFSINLRNELVKSKEEFDFKNIPVGATVVSIFMTGNMNMGDLIAKTIRSANNIEDLLNSPEKVEKVCRWCKSESRPELYVKFHHVVEEAINGGVRGMDQKVLNVFDEAYEDYIQLSVWLKKGREKARENALSHIITSDPDLLKEGFGKGKE